MTKKITWIDARINLKKLVEDDPVMLADALDSAYVAGLDNERESSRLILTRLLASAESVADARELRNIIKEYLLSY